MFKSCRTDRKKRKFTKKALSEFAIDLKNDNVDEFRKMSALIRFHYKVDTDNLSDNEFAKLWWDLRYCLDFENKRYNNTI